MRVPRPDPAIFLPLALALLAVILLLIVPALTGSEKDGRRVTSAASHR